MGRIAHGLHWPAWVRCAEGWPRAGPHTTLFGGAIGVSREIGSRESSTRNALIRGLCLTRVVVSMLAVAAAFAFVSVGAEVARASTFPGGNGRIVFVRSGAIFSVNPDGGGLKQLTFPGAA